MTVWGDDGAGVPAGSGVRDAGAVLRVLAAVAERAPDWAASFEAAVASVSSLASEWAFENPAQPPANAASATPVSTAFRPECRSFVKPLRGPAMSPAFEH